VHTAYRTLIRFLKNTGTCAFYRTFYVSVHSSFDRELDASVRYTELVSKMTCVA